MARYGTWRTRYMARYGTTPLREPGVPYRVAQDTNALNLNLYYITMLKWANAAWRSGQDNVPGKQTEVLADKTQSLRNAKDHAGGVP